MKRGTCVNLAIFTSMLIAQCASVPIREDAPGIEIMPAEVSHNGLDYVAVGNRAVTTQMKPAVIQQNNVYQKPYQYQQQTQYFPLGQTQYTTAQRPQLQPQQPQQLQQQYWYQQPVYQYQLQPSSPYYGQQYVGPSSTGTSSSPGILQTIANAFGLTRSASTIAPAPSSSNRFSIPFLFG
ncbi:nuclear polyadenylated RNA-binding protein NAB2-like [Anopheles albimanus]|uniref:nuclear polyadenylated RNA-binding protein NAB2-like n=1 Tax=Anopheles albimanus TaxID=7167 RepID=UPI001640606C|nr:nuclear polyadenylated RNA-binding protein NAB2-like [Anopheles albimanus]